MSEPRVVHRDAHLLVLFKPSGLPTTAPDRAHCLVEIAERVDPGAEHLHPSSRLDAEVSGLVTFARTRLGNRALLDARKRGRYERLYLGLAASAPDPASGQWSGAVGLDPSDKRKRRIVTSDTSGAQQALTRYEVAAAASAGVALLRLFPHTGRTHQLRLHASHAGSPLLGDVHYQGPRRVVLPDGRVVTPRRVMLHCAALRLPAIEGGDPLTLGADVPDDMRGIWTELGGDAGALESARSLA